MRTALLTLGLALAAVGANAQPAPQSTPPAPPAGAMQPMPFKMPEMCDFQTKKGDTITAPCEFDGLRLIGKADMSKFRMPPVPTAPADVPPAKPVAE